MRRFLGNLIGILTLSAVVAACGGSGASPAPEPRRLASGSARTLAEAAALSGTPLTIHMLGDSTMTRYAEDRRPQMGWGEAVPQFFDANVKVNNWALGGRSSRSFYYEATRWPAILPQINAGDYVIIQFGHNDQKSGGDYASFGTYAFCSDGTTDGEACAGRPDRVDPSVDISEHSYYQWLKKYVIQTRARGAIPILMSPIVRKYFSGTTITPQGQHSLGIIGGEAAARGNYVAAMKAVAAKYDVPLVDLTAETRHIVESYGNEAATSNLYIAADSTHPQVLFANLIAKRAVEGMKALNILNGYMVPVTSLIASPGQLDWSTRYVDMPSSKTVTLSAFDLAPAAGTLIVSAPANFQVSLDGVSWAQSVAIDYANGAFTKTLFVQFNAADTKSYSGTLRFTIGDTLLATAVAVQGTGISAAGGITSHASWFTAGTSLSAVSEGLVSANDATVRGVLPTNAKVLAVDGQDTTVARYVANAPARDNTQYLHFSVKPASGTFSVDTISAYLTSSGGSTVVADMEYSLNADFSGATKLNASPMSFVKETMTKKTFPVLIQVPRGGTLHVRILPWNSAGVLGKMLAVYGVRVSGTATSEAAPTYRDATSSFAVQRSGLTWNRITNLYSATITLTNTSGAALTGPVQLAFDNLTPTVTLDNASGLHDGVPYITVNTTSIAADAKLTVALTFRNPNKIGIGYTNSIFTGTF